MNSRSISPLLPIPPASALSRCWRRAPCARAISRAGSSSLRRRFPSISRPCKAAKLVKVRAEAQKRIYELDPEGVADISDWVANIRAFWNPRLDALEQALRKDTQ